MLLGGNYPLGNQEDTFVAGWAYLLEIVERQRVLVVGREDGVGLGGAGRDVVASLVVAGVARGLGVVGVAGFGWAEVRCEEVLHAEAEAGRVGMISRRRSRVVVEVGVGKHYVLVAGLLGGALAHGQSFAVAIVVQLPACFEVAFSAATVRFFEGQVLPWHSASVP